MNDTDLMKLVFGESSTTVTAVWMGCKCDVHIVPIGTSDDDDETIAANVRLVRAFLDHNEEVADDK
jgi:hypothetical protein